MSDVRILIVDDEPAVCEVLQRYVADEPWTTETAGDGREALALLCNRHFDVVVVDLVMPNLNGMDLLNSIQQRGIRTDVVILTGYGDVETAVQAMKMGAREFLEKPITQPEFVGTIRRLIEQRGPPPPHVLAGRMDAFLRDHACDSTLRLSTLCSRFRVSPRYASKMFREHVGASFRRRLCYWRIQEAKRLLASTDLPVYRVAEKCGFRNHRRLAEAFRRLERLSPGEYRTICADRRTKCR